MCQSIDGGSIFFEAKRFLSSNRQHSSLCFLNEFPQHWYALGVSGHPVRNVVHIFGSGLRVPKVCEVAEGFGGFRRFGMYRTVAVVNGGLEEVFASCWVSGGIWTVQEVFAGGSRGNKKVSEFTTKPPGLQVSGTGALGTGFGKVGFREPGGTQVLCSRSCEPGYDSTCAWPKQLKVLIEKLRLPPCASTIVARQALPP